MNGRHLKILLYINLLHKLRFAVTRCWVLFVHLDSEFIYDSDAIQHDRSKIRLCAASIVEVCYDCF